MGLFSGRSHCNCRDVSNLHVDLFGYDKENRSLRFLFLFSIYSTEKDSSKIYIYDGRGTKEPLKVLSSLHDKPVTIIRVSQAAAVTVVHFMFRDYCTISYCLQYNALFSAAISMDSSGMLNYWGGQRESYAFPKCVQFESLLDTDLYEFAKVYHSFVS